MNKEMVGLRTGYNFNKRKVFPAFKYYVKLMGLQYQSNYREFTNSERERIL